MKNPLKTRKIKPPSEINWIIREIFSESALANLCDEIYDQCLDIEKKI